MPGPEVPNIDPIVESWGEIIPTTVTGLFGNKIPSQQHVAHFEITRNDISIVDFLKKFIPERKKIEEAFSHAARKSLQSGNLGVAKVNAKRVLDIPDFSDRFKVGLIPVSVGDSVLTALGWDIIIGPDGYFDQRFKAKREAFDISPETKLNMETIMKIANAGIKDTLPLWQAYDEFLKAYDFWGAGLVLQEISRNHSKEKAVWSIESYISADQNLRRADLELPEDSMRAFIIGPEIAKHRYEGLIAMNGIFNDIFQQDLPINRELLYLFVNGLEVGFSYDELIDVCKKISLSKKAFSRKQRGWAKDLLKDFAYAKEVYSGGTRLYQSGPLDRAKKNIERFKEIYLQDQKEKY